MRTAGNVHPDTFFGDSNEIDYFAWSDRFGIDEYAPKFTEVLGFLLVSTIVIGAFSFLSGFNLRFAGAGYAAAFTALAWWRFELAMALTFAMVPFQQDLGGLPVRMAIAEINLALLIPSLVVRIGNLPVSLKLIVPPMLYLTFCLAVTLGKMSGAAVTSLVQMVLYLVFAVGVFSQARRSPNELFWCFDCLVIVETVFASIGLATNFALFGIHKNAWGASISLALIVAFEMWQMSQDRFRRTWLLGAVGILTMALILTVSRGGWLAAIMGISVLLILRRDWSVLWRLGIVVVPLVLIGWFLLPESKRDYAAGFETSRGNIQARFNSVGHAWNIWQESPWTGSGVGLRKEYDATNVVMLVLAETGIFGLFFFALIHVNLAAFIWRNHKWVPSMSIAFSCLALGGALVTARLAHGMVDHYWSRGAILAAWAAVGMALGVTNEDD